MDYIHITLQKYTFSLKQQIFEADFLEFWVVICLKIYPRKLRKLQIANCDPPVRVYVKLDIRTRI